VYLNDIWELKLDSLVWRKVSASGPRPRIRADGGVILNTNNNRMLIFGGKDGSTFYNDLWALDLTPGNEQWTQLSPTGNIPSGRAGFAHAQDRNGTKLYVFAGWDGWDYFNDLYELDVPTLTWSRLYPSGDLLLQRRNTCGAWDCFNTNFFVFGGEHGRGGYLGDAYYVHSDAGGTTRRNWEQMMGTAASLYIATVSSGQVRIRCVVPRTCHLKVRIPDATGRVVRDFFSGTMTPPGNWLWWNRKDANGLTVSSGTYHCRLETEHTTVSRKFIIAD